MLQTTALCNKLAAAQQHIKKKNQHRDFVVLIFLCEDKNICFIFRRFYSFIFRTLPLRGGRVREMGVSGRRVISSA